MSVTRGRKEAELQGVGSLVPYTSHLSSARVHVVSPWLKGSSFPKQIEAATAKSAGREHSETPRAGPGPTSTAQPHCRLPSASLQLPTQFSYFLSPDSGHPCLADHGRAVCHQLVLTRGPAVCCSFTDLPVAQHLHPVGGVGALGQKCLP